MKRITDNNLIMFFEDLGQPGHLSGKTTDQLILDLIDARLELEQLKGENNSDFINILKGRIKEGYGNGYQIENQRKVERNPRESGN